VAERILIDTGPIVAILCREDASHSQCVELLRSLDGELCTTWPVVSESIFLLGGRADRIKTLLEMFASGAIHIASLGSESTVIEWLEAFYERFNEHAPDLADATLMYLAERDSLTKIFTLDTRDFAIYRTSDGRALQIMISIDP
jgi:predicted nucleic acid-binding protein